MLNKLLNIALLIPSLLATSLFADEQLSGRRLAVVVGIDKYRVNGGLGDLAHAGADATSVSEALRDAGFTVIEMTHKAARKRGKEHLVPNRIYIRDMISSIPGYSSVIDSLKEEEQFTIGGYALPIPSFAVWESRPEIRNKILAILREHGILGTNLLEAKYGISSAEINLTIPSTAPKPNMFSNSPGDANSGRSLSDTPDKVDTSSSRRGTVSHAEALNAAGNFSVGSGIASFKSRFPEFGVLIDSLQQNEKMANGLIAFPSEPTWNSRPEVRDRIIDIFRKNGVLK